MSSSDCLNRVVFLRRIFSFAARSTGELAQLAMVSCAAHETVRSFSFDFMARMLRYEQEDSCRQQFLVACILCRRQSNHTLWIVALLIDFWITVRNLNTIYCEVEPGAAAKAFAQARPLLPSDGDAADVFPADGKPFFGTPLAFAARCGTPELVHLLLHQSFPPFLYDSSGRNAVHCAAARQDGVGREILEVIVEFVTNREDKDAAASDLKRLCFKADHEERNAIMIAASSGNAAVVQRLLELNVYTASNVINVDDDDDDVMKDEHGATLLHSIAMVQQLSVEILALLQSAFAFETQVWARAIGARDAFGKSCLDLAAEFLNVQLVERILPISTSLSVEPLLDRAMHSPRRLRGIPRPVHSRLNFGSASTTASVPPDDTRADAFFERAFARGAIDVEEVLTRKLRLVQLLLAHCEPQSLSASAYSGALAAVVDILVARACSAGCGDILLATTELLVSAARGRAGAMSAVRAAPSSPRELATHLRVAEHIAMFPLVHSEDDRRDLVAALRVLTLLLAEDKDESALQRRQLQPQPQPLNDTSTFTNRFRVGTALQRVGNAELEAELRRLAELHGLTEKLFT